MMIGPPTEEVIARWDHLTNTSPVNLTAEEMIKLGHSLDSVQYPPEMGGVSSFVYLSAVFSSVD